VAAGQTPLLLPVWGHVGHPRARWLPHLASLPPQSPVCMPPPPCGTSTPKPHSHSRRAPDPCVTSFRRCQSQSSPSSSKSTEPPNAAPLLRVGPPKLFCAPPAMALSDSPSGPTAPPRQPPHAGAPHQPTFLTPRSVCRRRAWFLVSPLLSFGSSRYTTSPTTSSTHSPPPLADGGPHGRRRWHQPSVAEPGPAVRRGRTEQGGAGLNSYT
jgi:hypothetical protein